MFKKLLVMLMVVSLCVGLVACIGSEDSFPLTLTDGSTKNMTIKELYNWKNENSGRSSVEFEEKINSATISGSGKVVSVWVNNPISFDGTSRKGHIFPCTVKLDNGIALDINLVYGGDGYGYDNPDYNYPGDIPDVDIYEGDVLNFKGTIDIYSIKKDELEVSIRSNEIDEWEKKVGLEYIPNVTLIN